jgi:maltose alpha-D-glucosyltransferase/alpha-amylase
MKMFRRVEPGPNPDVEIGEYLTRSGFTRVPPLKGTIEYVKTAHPAAAVVMLQEYVPNQGNAWQVTVEHLGRYFDHVVGLGEPHTSMHEVREYVLGGGPTPPAIAEAITTYLATADVLGRRTGELHVQLSENPEPDFAPEPLTHRDLEQLAGTMRREAEHQLRTLESRSASFDPRARELARAVLEQRDALLRRFDDLTHATSGGARLRCHGDYHLGQILVTEGDIVILDFEGEPARPLSDRRAKCSPLRDVAGMLRSFSYAASTALNAATLTRPEDLERLAPWSELWETWVSAVYLRSYLAATADAGILPARSEDLDLLLQTLVVNKAIYELGYELNNRPDWVHVPLTGVLRLRTPLHG